MPQQVRHHQTRVHAMHPHAGASGLLPQRLGELANPPLAGRVRILQRDRPLIALAVDVDQVAVALVEENRQCDPRGVERAEDVSTHHPCKVVDRSGSRRTKDA